MGAFAWVTLATNDSYSLGALVLAHSLKQAGTTHQLAVLVTPGVTAAMREKLSSVFNTVQEVNILDSRDEANLRLLKRPELGITFTKLHCWKLTQYEKCVFLDADTLVLKNSDELFEREELSAAPDVGWPDCFNSGVFVYRPSLDTYEKLIQFAIERGSFDGGDQGLLNLYFSDWAHKDISRHLPFIYNLCSTACYSYLPAFKQFGANAKIIHFIGAQKPWLQYFNTETKKVQPSGDSSHLQEVLQHWWDIFCSLIHPLLSPTMAGLAGAFAQLTLGVAKTAEQDAFESVLRKQAWEVGNIDYLGKDAFENIWSKITETLSSTLTSADIAVPVQPAPVETQSQTTSQEAVAKSIDTTTPTETIVTPSQPVPLPEAQTEVSLTSQITPIDTFTEQTAQPTGPEPVVSEFTQACPFVPNIQSGLVTTEKSIPTVADTATSGLTAKESSEVAIPNVESAVESPTTPTEKFSSATAAVSTLEPSEKTSPVRSESVAVTSNVDPQTTSALETPVIAPTTQLQTLPAAQSVVPTDAAVSVAESVVTPVASPEGISPIAELELTTVTSEAEVPTRTETAVPVAPTTPTETAVPVGSVTPTEAAVPVAPTTPTESAVSVAPIIPTETAVPVTPTTPTETTVPVAQTTPTETTEPVVPTTPTETAVPVAPTTPIETAVLVTESGVTSITSTKTIAPVIDPVLSPVTLTETPVTVAAVTLTESGTPISEAAAAAPAPPAEVAEVSQAKLVQATPPVIPGTPPANVPIEKSKLTTETAVPETSPPVEGGSTATPTPPPRKTDKPKKSSGKPKK
ncbi:hypothetical protein ABEB36_011479 [Hypothenemus hampei]|uniref:glycogenin glucosyltransferase n=1 Tax=Hypothenemus hampei TaxID=57062 RepID=A0ABD1EG31_HYPHA